MVCWKRKVAGGWPRNFLFMDLGYEDEEEFEDVAWPCPTCTNAYPTVADMRLEDFRGFKDHGNLMVPKGSQAQGVNQLQKYE